MPIYNLNHRLNDFKEMELNDFGALHLTFKNNKYFR